MKKIIVIIATLLMLSPLTVSAQDEIMSRGGAPLRLIRTTVYDGPSDHTATGRKAEYGIVAYDPAYYGKICYLYTEDMRYIGIFECEDTGGHLIRTGQRLDVYTGTTLESCYDWVDEYGTHCYVQWIESEG